MKQIASHEDAKSEHIGKRFPEPPKGRGFGRFIEGDPITRPDQLQVGDLLTEYSVQFNACNLIRVTSVSSAGDNFHGMIVDPDDPSRRGIGTFDDICFWDWECDPESPDTFKRALHRAILPMR